MTTLQAAASRRERPPRPHRPQLHLGRGEVLLNGVNKTVSLPNSQDPANPISITLNGPSQNRHHDTGRLNGREGRGATSSHGMQSAQARGRATAPARPTVSALTPPAQYDLWSGRAATTYHLTGTNTALRRRAFASVITNTTTVKTHVDSDGNTIRYILGDVFHSKPGRRRQSGQHALLRRGPRNHPTETVLSTASVGNHGATRL